MESAEVDNELFLSLDLKGSKSSRRNPMANPLAIFGEYKRIRDKRVEELRKERRYKSFKSKRMHEDNKHEEINSETIPAIPPTIETGEDVAAVSLSELPAVVSEFNSSDPEECLSGLNKLRRLLSARGIIPIQQILDAGVLPRILELLRASNNPLLQLEAAWCITNITTGSELQIMAVINKGGLKLLIELLKSPHAKIQQQAIWALGNVAGENHKLRNVVLELGMLETVAEVLSGANDLSLMVSCLRCVIQLCKGKHAPIIKRVESVCTFLLMA
eukprot:TRINITY_DN5089_c0_g1_i10.p1 TRINITY_DN5089_c0_g1~~TRINITY_DN5089_c0_g1_i10.p1  ORF type:complete len:274 (+),score=53.03 TRINITY_DN5089_c0_g1_i10:121-942(+)